MTRAVVIGLVVAAIVGGFLVGLAIGDATAQTCERTRQPIVVDLSNDRHPALILHARHAVESGKPRFLTVDRAGADRRRRQDLSTANPAALPPRDGFDRDEYPPAVAAESGLQPDGSRADLEYVLSSENRSGGAALGRGLAGYCDGQRFILEAGRP